MIDNNWKEAIFNSPLFKLEDYNYNEHPKVTLKSWLYGYFDEFSLDELNSINKDLIDEETEVVLNDYIKEKYD